ncbi:MAG: dehalogenase [Chloroflexi bacterium]|nr:dehalogenase [Chloroflexota bacterium]
MFFIGIIFAVAITALLFWIFTKGISVRWYEWILGILGIALLYFAVINFHGGLYEHTTQAAWMYLLILGIPALILLGIPAYFVYKRKG